MSLPLWLHWLDQTPSTNSWSIEHLDRLQHGDVVFTPQQTAGRGQFDRVWHSPPGVLTASFILDGLDPGQHSGLSLSVGLAVFIRGTSIIPLFKMQSLYLQRPGVEHFNFAPGFIWSKQKEFEPSYK